MHSLIDLSWDGVPLSRLSSLKTFTLSMITGNNVVTIVSRLLVGTTLKVQDVVTYKFATTTLERFDVSFLRVLGQRKLSHVLCFLTDPSFLRSFGKTKREGKEFTP